MRTKKRNLWLDNENISKARPFVWNHLIDKLHQATLPWAYDDQKPNAVHELTTK